MQLLTHLCSRALASVLALSLLTATVPTSAFAAEPPTSVLPTDPIPMSDPVPLAEVKHPCKVWLGKTAVFFSKMQWAVLPLGLTAGIANDVTLTITTGQYQLIPVAMAKWLPFFNESANVLSTATGKKWIYSGLSKQVIDGVALGALAGQALSAGADHGAIVGALNLAAGVGLTFWFPNKYFHTMMHAVPGKLPKSLRKFGRSGVGQGVIGIGLIILLEQVLEHTLELIEKIPLLFAQNTFADRSIAAVRAPLKIEHALALFFLESKLEKVPAANRDQILLWIAGASSSRQLFVADSILKKPSVKISVTAVAPAMKLVDSEIFHSLLNPKEVEVVRTHLMELAMP